MGKFPIGGIHMAVRALIEKAEGLQNKYLSSRKTRISSHFFVLTGIRKQGSNQQLEMDQIISDLHFSLIIRKSLIIPKVSRAIPCPCDIGYKIIV